MIEINLPTFQLCDAKDSWQSLELMQQLIGFSYSTLKVMLQAHNYNITATYATLKDKIRLNLIVLDYKETIKEFFTESKTLIFMDSVFLKFTLQRLYTQCNEAVLDCITAYVKEHYIALLSAIVLGLYLDYTDEEILAIAFSSLYCNISHLSLPIYKEYNSPDIDISTWHKKYHTVFSFCDIHKLFNVYNAHITQTTLEIFQSIIINHNYRNKNILSMHNIDINKDIPLQIGCIADQVSAEYNNHIKSSLGAIVDNSILFRQQLKWKDKIDSKVIDAIVDLASVDKNYLHQRGDIRHLPVNTRRAKAHYKRN